jgi:molybdate transport system ATP-binding protein
LLRAEISHQLGALSLQASLDVTRSRCLALAGPSGAGKTTLLRLIAGTEAAQRARIECDGEVWVDTARSLFWPPERRRCGYVFQDYALFPHLPAWRNVAYGMRHLPKRARREAAMGLLERFGVAAVADARPARLSGGERQRVALARALAAAPSALLLDEPLAALDAENRARAGRELAQVVRELDRPAVLVTHDFADASSLAEEIAIIDRGRVIQRGSASALAAAPNSAFVADFTGAVVLRGIARSAGEGLTAVELDGGGTVFATGARRGPVAACVYPWELVIHGRDTPPASSAQNVLAATVTSTTVVAERVRVGLQACQPLVAEITRASARSLGIVAGSRVYVSWKATATRLSGR